MVGELTIVIIILRHKEVLEFLETNVLIIDIGFYNMCRHVMIILVPYLCIDRVLSTNCKR